MISATEVRRDAVRWLPAERLGECRVDARLRPWLIGQGLLSARLRALFGERFELRAGEAWTALLDAEDRRHLAIGGGAALFREEELRCDGRLWVLARTIMPDSTLAAHSWLAELGEAGLGETLAALSGVERSSYEYAWLPAGSPLVQGALAAGAHAGLWARRSRLSLRGAPLALHELFVPGMGGA